MNWYFYYVRGISTEGCPTFARFGNGYYCFLAGVQISVSAQEQTVYITPSPISQQQHLEIGIRWCLECDRACYYSCSPNDEAETSRLYNEDCAECRRFVFHED